MQKFEDSFDGAYHSSGKKNPAGSCKKTRIVINVAETQYAVVKHVAKKFKWNLLVEPTSNFNFDICWIDGHVRTEFFARMQAHQKVDHFPGMGVLSRKNNLGKNLMAFRKKFPADYQFFPITWNLPNDYVQLEAYHECRQQGKAQTFIVKPEASCQGRGIFLTRNIEKLKNDRYVVQRYMHKPYLIDGLKFDLRIYVLVTGIDPLRIFVYEEGLARFATQPYKPPRSQNLQNRFMHLTNYAVNKQSPNFIFNESATDMDVGHKRSLTSIYKRIAQQGHDVELIKQKISDIFIKTIITGYPHLSSTYMSGHADNFSNDMCFQVLGFDVMLDYKLNPYLIQINYTPSFTTDTPLDRHIKKNLITDTLTLLNISDKWKKDMKTKRDKQIQQRMVTGKRKKYTNEERKVLMNQQARKRSEFDSKAENLGGFTKVFMLNQEQMGQYKKYYDYSFELFNSSSGTNTLNGSSICSYVNTSAASQYQFYKHYFDESSNRNGGSSNSSLKGYMTSSSFSKSKKNKDKDKDKQIQKNTSKIKSRQQTVGVSQGRRISSAKLKKQKLQKKSAANLVSNTSEYEKKSVKGSSKTSEEGLTGKDFQFEPCIENESIFRNKKLENLGVGVLRKRKSQLLLIDANIEAC